MFDIPTAVTHLRNDPIMSGLIDSYDPPAWRDQRTVNLFTDLIESIISQQLSTKVADVILARVYQLLPQHQFTPRAVLELETETVRACGVSYSKIRYFKAVAQAALDGSVDFDHLDQLTDEEVVASLTQIVGVGPWTAEMMLIFSLHRPDVFSVGDLGLRTAVSKLYGIDREDRVAILGVSRQWSPYRSLASRYLWLSLNNSP
jgi:DNA-3-methyladenine glycosylase II